MSLSFPQDSQKGVFKLKLVAEVSQTPEHEEVMPIIVQLISPPFLGRTVLTAGPAKFGKDLTKQEHGVRNRLEISWLPSRYEWMNEWCIYIALYCALLYTQSALQSCVCVCVWGGGSLLNHHQCAASTWMMRWLPQDNGTSALTTHQLQVETRESHRANQVDGDY